MNNIRFEIDGKTITRQTPAQWNQLTLEQLLFVAPRVMLINKSLRLRRELLYYFLNMKEKHLHEMNRSQENALFDAVDWLFKTPQLTKQLIPEVEVLTVMLRGPEDDMKNITVSQFAFADKFMGMFLKTKDEEFLNLLLGTLWVRKGEKFMKEEIESNAEYIKHLKLDQRLAMLAFFLGCRNKISEGNHEIFKKSTKVNRSKSGWLGFFYELAGPKTGTYNDVAAMNFFEMLGIMRKINEDAREAEKRNKRRR